MPNPPFRLILRFVFAFLGTGTALADNPAICGGKPVSSRIAEAIDGTSFRLADGRMIRLAHVIAPLPIDGDPAAVAQARNVLAEIADGKEAQIFLTSEDRDRYGRFSALGVSIEQRVWLEAALLRRGSVRVYLPASEACAKALLQFETQARAAGAGLWADKRFEVLHAENVEGLLAAEGRFVIVEGLIRRVGDRRERIYLDFGRRFTEDFTIIVPNRFRRSLAALGPEPKYWRGKRVRVRGIVLSWGGPAIELNSANAIELLDSELPANE